VNRDDAEIHDLGHAAYAGARTPPSRRFLVVARNVLAVALRRWVVRVPLIAAVGITVAAAAVMYFLRHTLTDVVRARGVAVPQAEAIVFFAGAFYELVAFVLAVVVACAAIADDLRLGAFQFYFARALRPRDYVAGKLLGLALLIGLPMFLGPLVLALMRLVYADDLAHAATLADVIPRAMLHGALGTAAYVLPAAGLGALTRRRQTAQALFAVYYLLVATAAFALSMQLRFPLLRLVSLPNDLSVLGMAIFGLPASPFDPPAAASGLSLVGFCALGLYAVWWRVRGAETAGLASG
jgi:hypothetical protein